MIRDTNKDKIADALTEKAVAAYSRIDNTRLCELVKGLILHLDLQRLARRAHI